MKELQETFDKVARHMLQQNARSGVKGSCQYRHNDLKCAVGALIADEHYTESLEGKTINTDEVEHAVVASLGRPLIAGERALLTAFQSAHDYAYVDRWRQEIAHIARTFNLSKSVLDEFPIAA